MGSEEAVRIPDTLEELLSPGWLNTALGRPFPGVRVAAAVVGRVESRISTNACFRIECEGELPEGLSANLCAKGYFSDTGTAAHRMAGESETRFYRDLTAAAGVRTLPGVFAEWDVASDNGVVITEDVTASGATFLDPRDRHPASEVATSLEQYVTLHARTWNGNRLGAAEWLSSPIARTAGARGIPEIQSQFDGPIGAGVPKEARDAVSLVGAFKALTEVNTSSPSWCLLHGDAHIGNLFRDSAGLPCLLDWQLVQRGPWYVDVGYHIASSLSVEDRRASERDLLGHYLERLASQGVAVPTWDEVWFGFCCGIVYGLFLWSITQKVKPEITAVLLERIGTAAADHDAYRVVLGERA
ncbi:MAG: aminoglycoside phosphotransferase family protein [Acidimicrobiales bacterium]